MELCCIDFEVRTAQLQCPNLVLKATPQTQLAQIVRLCTSQPSNTAYKPWLKAAVNNNYKANNKQRLPLCEQFCTCCVGMW